MLFFSVTLIYFPQHSFFIIILIILTDRTTVLTETLIVRKRQSLKDLTKYVEKR